MKNLTKMIGLASIVLATGCATMTPAQKTALLGQSLSILGSINTPRNNTIEGNRAKEILKTSGNVISNQAQMQHDLEYANAGKSQVVINNNPPNYQNGNFQNYSNQNSSNNQTPQGFFMYKNFVDFNNNGQVNRDELVGLNEFVYDLRNLDFLTFSFYSGGNKKYDNRNLNLKIYSLDDGKIINYFDNLCISSRIQNFVCESKYFIRSGKYKAVLNISNNETSSLDFEVIK
jgi:hypothetical protein